MGWDEMMRQVLTIFFRNFPPPFFFGFLVDGAAMPAGGWLHVHVPVCVHVHVHGSSIPPFVSMVWSGSGMDGVFMGDTI